MVELLVSVAFFGKIRVLSGSISRSLIIASKSKSGFGSGDRILVIRTSVFGEANRQLKLFWICRDCSSSDRNRNTF